MDDELLKLECLKLATQQGLKGDEARREVERMYALIKGRSDPNAQLSELEGMRLATQQAKARIVGTEGHLEPPFDDYVKE